MQRGVDSTTTKRLPMRIFLTGANGFVGGAVASALIADGHRVRGLVRDHGKAIAVAARGIEAVIGALQDTALLQTEARASDGVVNAANSDHCGAVEALISGIAGSGKPLIHTSGISVVADRATMGEPSERIFLRRYAKPARDRTRRSGGNRPDGARCSRGSLRCALQQHDLWQHT